MRFDDMEQQVTLLFSCFGCITISIRFYLAFCIAASRVSSSVNLEFQTIELRYLRL